MRYIILMFTFLYQIPSIALAQEKVPQSLVDSAFKEIFSDTAESFYINEFEGFSYYYGSFTDTVKTECIIVGEEHWFTVTNGGMDGRVVFFQKTGGYWYYESIIPKHFRILKVLDINNDGTHEILTHLYYHESATSSEYFTIYTLVRHKIIPVFEWTCFDYKNSMRKGEIGDTLSSTCTYSFLDENTLSLSFQYEFVRTVNQDFSFDIEFEDNYTFSSAEETMIVDLSLLYAIAQKKYRLTIPHD